MLDATDEQERFAFDLRMNKQKRSVNHSFNHLEQDATAPLSNAVNRWSSTSLGR
jgi:hypothetical protein